MHGPINVKSPNNISKWQMWFNSAFKGLLRVIFARRQTSCSYAINISITKCRASGRWSCYLAFRLAWIYFTRCAFIFHIYSIYLSIHFEVPTAGNKNCSRYTKLCEIALFTRRNLHVRYRARFVMFVVKTLVVHCMVMQYCQPLVATYGLFLVVVLWFSYYFRLRVFFLCFSVEMTKMFTSRTHRA
jgi:hypothetical protein